MLHQAARQRQWSRHFEVVDSGYYAEWWAPGLSDHVGGWAWLKVIP
jgi:hypothetical protein